jgi:hypothetical protein
MISIIDGRYKIHLEDLTFQYRNNQIDLITFLERAEKLREAFTKKMKRREEEDQ